MTKITAYSKPELHVVLAYGSLSAACRATECFKEKRRTDFDEGTISWSPWSFGMLESPALFTRAAENVRRAHVLAIAVCESERPLSGVTELWLKTCLSRRHQAHLTVAGIFGGDDFLTGAGKPWLESVQRVVVGAGCAFLAWHVSGTANFLR
jgi:hypothetical protein